MLASHENNSILGKSKVRLETVDSTNNYAANFIKLNKGQHGTVILADVQTNGRGQRGSVWQSEAGMNLQFSLILLDLQVAITDQQLLNHLFSLSVVRTLARFGLVAKIKWPNDILVGNLKIAGILIENQIKGDGISSSIVGIGLNVNQLVFKNLYATSIRNEKGNFIRTEDVLDSLCYQFNLDFPEFLSQNYSQINQDYLLNLWGFRQKKMFEDHEGSFEGEIVGIDSFGRLEIRVLETIKKYDVKEVRYLLHEK